MFLDLGLSDDFNAASEGLASMQPPPPSGSDSWWKVPKMGCIFPSPSWWLSSGEEANRVIETQSELFHDHAWNWGKSAKNCPTDAKNLSASEVAKFQLVLVWDGGSEVVNLQSAEESRVGRSLFWMCLIAHCR